MIKTLQVPAWEALIISKKKLCTLTSYSQEPSIFWTNTSTDKSKSCQVNGNSKHPSGKYTQASAVNRCAHVLAMSHPLHKAPQKSIEDEDSLPSGRAWVRHTFWRGCLARPESQEAAVVLHGPTSAKQPKHWVSVCVVSSPNMRTWYNSLNLRIRDASAHSKQDHDFCMAHLYRGSDLEALEAGLIHSRTRVGLIWFVLRFVFAVLAFYGTASATETSLSCR